MAIELGTEQGVQNSNPNLAWICIVDHKKGVKMVKVETLNIRLDMFSHREKKKKNMTVSALNQPTNKH